MQWLEIWRRCRSFRWADEIRQIPLNDWSLMSLMRSEFYWKQEQFFQKIFVLCARLQIVFNNVLQIFSLFSFTPLSNVDNQSNFPFVAIASLTIASDAFWYHSTARYITKTYSINIIILLVRSYLRFIQFFIRKTIVTSAGFQQLPRSAYITTFWIHCIFF